MICLNQCSCSWLNIIMYKVQPFTDVCGEQVRPSENGSFSVCILSYQHHTTVTCFCVLKLSGVQNSHMVVFVAAILFTAVISD